jgi:hypothetical protein
LFFPSMPIFPILILFYSPSIKTFSCLTSPTDLHVQTSVPHQAHWQA